MELRPHTTVRGISQRAHGVTLTTDHGTLDADHVILCVASWLPALLGDLGLSWRITLSQEQVSYFATPNVRDFTPDRDFIIDRVPGHPGMTIGIGAGHAAKFASLLGKILADLATTGRTAYPIDAFRADRPALTDPGYEPDFRLAGSHVSA